LISKLQFKAHYCDPDPTYQHAGVMCVCVCVCEEDSSDDDEEEEEDEVDEVKLPVFSKP